QEGNFELLNKKIEEINLDNIPLPNKEAILVRGLSAENIVEIGKEEYVSLFQLIDRKEAERHTENGLKQILNIHRRYATIHHITSA
ncbi:MAG: hypothetical protein J7L45_00865, partial [Candidatus Aenigmarchaeota archaeon]|nr:hypothetical protein [Candidatus Aenigmarchaeota archaeon]